MKKLLLHSCCGPCSTAVIEKLINDYDLSVFYFNPNITDEPEYAHRLSEQKRLISEVFPAVRLIEGEYHPESFFEAVRGFEDAPEGGARCSLCFRLRMEETAKKAVALGYDCFDTTLTVSPHKNYDVISSICKELSAKYGIEYLDGNYKKMNGYKRSVDLSKEYGLYRQNYCGCEFSKWFNK